MCVQREERWDTSITEMMIIRVYRDEKAAKKNFRALSKNHNDDEAETQAPAAALLGIEKVAAVLLVLVGSALCSLEPAGYRSPSSHSQYLPPYSRQPSTRLSAPSRQYEHHEPAKYNFAYQVKDSNSGNDYSHQESRDGSLTRGSYSVLLPDGRRQIVEYEADEAGYRPKITYEAAQPQSRYGQPSRAYPGGPY
ncbi:hypothetical protein TSAR_002856 [Trichomalopsis sarcophagae]|uniref:Pro-resilin n=1 Tax=Trichomalopsis sarcophagae TaxID=543379 RepID=A0A232FMT6_9HYME|nr:hypothetical protein TSAR_002856 [Trichomalopsis sarcophagae]